MTTQQVWALAVGVPALVLAAGLFYGRSRVRSALGYAALAVAFGAVLLVDPAWAAVVGVLMALAYAAGRGGSADHEPFDSSTMAVPDQTRMPVRGYTATGTEGNPPT